VRKVVVRQAQDQDDGSSTDEGVPVEPHHYHDEVFVGGGHEMEVVVDVHVAQHQHDNDGGNSSHDEVPPSSSGRSSTSGVGDERSGSEGIPHEGAQEVGTCSGSSDDDDVVILSMHAYNGSVHEREHKYDSSDSSDDDDDQYEDVNDFNFSEDVPRYLKEVLLHDGLVSKKGKRQVRYRGWSISDALKQYVQRCKDQGAPDLMQVKPYVIQLRACLLRNIEMASIFVDKERPTIDKIRTSSKGRHILDMLPVIYLLRLFKNGSLSTDMPKKSHLPLFQFLQENAEVYFPHQAQAVRDCVGCGC